jgi:hypothetical protein
MARVTLFCFLIQFMNLAYNVNEGTSETLVIVSLCGLSAVCAVQFTNVECQLTPIMVSVV